MKKIILTVLITPSLIYGMNDFQKPNQYGQTALFFIPLTINKTINNDRLGAHMAAKLIIVDHCNVNQKDIHGISPLDLASLNQRKLPNIYNVMLAGKTKQECEKKQPHSDSQGVWSFDELLSWSKIMQNSDIPKKWGKAMEILLTYFDDSPSNIMPLKQRVHDPFGGQNQFKQNLLFYTALAPDDINEKQLQALDLQRARIAANLIIFHDNDIDAQDQHGLTPLTLAEYNQKTLPHVYRVMIAGKNKKKCEKNISLANFDKYLEALHILLCYIEKP